MLSQYHALQMWMHLNPHHNLYTSAPFYGWEIWSSKREDNLLKSAGLGLDLPPPTLMLFTAVMNTQERTDPQASIRDFYFVSLTFSTTKQ